MNQMPAGQELALRDIHLPPAPELWPPAPGWWVLLVLGSVLLGLISWWLIRQFRVLSRRRRILDELAGLKDRNAGPELAAEVSALLKRVALARFPRARVASLTGQSWLHFLDLNGGKGKFAQGPGRVLAEGPYAPAPDFEKDALLTLAGEWIRRNT